MATTGNRSNKALKEAMTKTQLLNALSESTGLQKKDVALVLDELGVLIERHIKRRAVGTFTLPGLLKIARRPFLSPPNQKETCDVRWSDWLDRRAAELRHQWTGYT